MASTKNNIFLIWGGRGWIAGHLKTLLESQGKTVHTTAVRMEDREAVIGVLDDVKPTHVINCAGCTGRPNIDWCEDHKQETIRSNVIGALNLTDACYQRSIHVTVFATGCKTSTHLHILTQTSFNVQASTTTTKHIPKEDPASKKPTQQTSQAPSTP